MSYRELRNFTEIMRSLGYPRLISIDNFRTPNFELVSEILVWLVNRYDPSLDIADSIETEADRVFLLKTIGQHMAGRAGIKLNAKRLYGADGYAVRELLKIGSLLYRSLKEDSKDEEDENAEEHAVSAKIQEVKLIRELASEITSKGAELYDLLRNEPLMREVRQKSVGRNLELDDIEKSIKESIANVSENVARIEEQIAGLKSDEENLEKKIEKKKVELERAQKRYEGMQSVRPAFMDEYEKLEQNLQALYSVYLEKFRNLEYLENELEQFHRNEQERMDESDRQLKKLQQKLRDEELKMMRGEQEFDENDDLLMMDQDKKRPGKSHGGPRGSGPAMEGTMNPDEDSDSEEEDEEEEEEEEDELDGDETDSILVGSDESDELELGEEGELEIGEDLGSSDEDF
mmetsp:Transcript_17883/g.44341  ORF Transcript_17883/g.44341 Transcript_17883/m.44341 type:complete len:404 (-) Transcript_17883:337-1548(-)|eukprot:CAMPEP_0113879762 /NCGR_PEP_ID=MMETSP0780_2-20120614/7413_1 /TAXON_ID=652834 /ORGANISM="Palpitomonas bilix" /LENGTH=403 /DNA_ID=CAMNT_0000866369 /DNA_START=167 /DNA_END=1378 /DNA_ORIENTATION=+ /assembly_acc=CAM_ASM_000599